MKYFLLIIFLTSRLFDCGAQQFSFQMNFVDSLGYSDSLVLGYDDLATDSIDPSFGEVNLAPWYISGVEMEVRNTDVMNHLPFPYPSFATKKQIVKSHCGLTGFSVIEIDIHSYHWPVTGTWNKTLFNDSCRNGSFFTSLNPSGWWGNGSQSDLGLVPLLSIDSVTFTPNSGISNCDTSFCYWLIDGNWVCRYWLVFGDSSLLPNSISENANTKAIFKLFPNPSHSYFNVDIPNHFGQIRTLEIYSSLGNLLRISESMLTIDLTSFPNGIYFIVATNIKDEKLVAIALKD